MDCAITPTTLAVCQGICKVSHHPPPVAPSWILILSVILSHISQSLHAHLATVCCHGNKLWYSNIAFVVKSKFNEGGSEIGGGGPYPTTGPPPAGSYIRILSSFLVSIVKINAFYEYCIVFQVICLRVRG